MESQLPRHLIEQNLLFLGQAADLVHSLSRAHYAEASPPLFPASIGSHLRHILDHYDSILLGISNGLIDYYARARDPATQTDPEVALRRIAAVTAACRELTPSPPLQLRISLADPNQTIETTLERELHFGISHTLHHFALIAQICRHYNRPVPEGFGVAPSTLAYRNSLSQKE